MEDLQPGNQLGIYEIVSRIETGGGMSTVYRALVSGSNHKVVLKVVPAKCPDDCLPKRWKRRVNSIEWEAKVCKSLGSHPNLVRFHGNGKTDDWFFISFDYVDGVDLEGLIICNSANLRDVLSVKRAVMVAKKVANGLHYIHNKGFVHKDIKCGNVLLGKRTDKIIDLGLAYDMFNIDNNLESEPNVVLGTLSYLPPEYIRKNKPHPSGDIYSLGATLFHMLAGEPPFEHVIDDLIDNFYHGTANFDELALRLNSLAPDVPESVQRVCLKALAKSPDDRYQSARKFYSALDDVLKKL